MKKNLIKILGVILILVGIYTFYTRTSILFGWFNNNDPDSVYLPLTQVCCYIDSIIYIICGFLFFYESKLSTPLLFIATIIMFIGYSAMLFYINSGITVSIYVAGEMLLRTSATMLYTAIAWYLFTRARVKLPKGYDEESFKKLVRKYEAEKRKQKV